MAKSQAKTKAEPTSVADFIAAIPEDRRREEALALDALHRRVTGLEPVMWGPSIIGYGSYHYVYDSGREGDSCRAGFSPRKGKHVCYLTGSFDDCRAEADALFAALGKHSLGTACLYINKLADVDMAVLEKLVALSWRAMNVRYPD